MGSNEGIAYLLRYVTIYLSLAAIRSAKRLPGDQIIGYVMADCFGAAPEPRLSLSGSAEDQLKRIAEYYRELLTRKAFPADPPASLKLPALEKNAIAACLEATEDLSLAELRQLAVTWAHERWLS